jgi:hypothetical protein
MSLFGRDELAWDQTAAAGEAFLIERARLTRLTSYTELNVTLIRRTGLPGFDFGRQDERATMGHLLGLIVERNRPATGLMISAMVTYLDSNDAGPLLAARCAHRRPSGATPRAAPVHPLRVRLVRSRCTYDAAAREHGRRSIPEARRGMDLGMGLDQHKAALPLGI